MVYSILPGILSAFLFYFFYSSIFFENKSFKEHIPLLFTSLFAIGTSILFESGFHFLLKTENAFLLSFLGSSVPEEFAKWFGLQILFRRYRKNQTATEAVYFGIMFGILFGLIESLFYSFHAFPRWTLILRGITAMPMHILTSACLGYFACFESNSYQKQFSNWVFAKAMFITISFHFCFNYSIFLGGNALFIIPFLILGLFIFVEYLIVVAKSLLPPDILKISNLHFDQFLLVERYFRFEKWIEDSQSHTTTRIRLFKEITKRSFLLFASFSLILLIALSIWIFFSDIILNLLHIQFSEYFIIFLFYPFFIGISFLIGGTLNPLYFQNPIFRLTACGLVSLKNSNHEEDSLVLNLERVGFYSIFLDPEKFGDAEVKIRFQIVDRFFEANGKIVWVKENKSSEESMKGAIVYFTKTPWKLYFTWKWLTFSQTIF